MSVCKSIRHYSLLQLGTFRRPTVTARSRQTRGLATSGFHLGPRIPTRTTSIYIPGPSCRSYWWSSRSTTTSPEPSPPPVTDAPRTEPTSIPSKPATDLTSNSPADPASNDPTSNIVTAEQVTADTQSVIDSVPDVSNIIPPALQLGDLKELGFSNFTPVGAVQTFLEWVQVTTGLPWWGAITVTTIVARLFVLSFTIQSTRSAARMAPVKPQADVLMKEMRDAKVAGDQMRLQIAVLKLQKLRKDHGFGLGSSLSGPLSQAVVGVSMFIAIKRLCDFPLPQLQFESVGWLKSLTVPDPYYILPVLSLASMNVQLYLSKADMAAGGQNALHFANLFRVLGFMFFPVIANLPAGLLVHLVVNIICVVIQGVLLRHPRIRKALDIPPLPVLLPAQSPGMRDSWNALRQWMKDQKTDAAAKAQQRAKIPTFTIPTARPTTIRRMQATTSRRTAKKSGR